MRANKCYIILSILINWQVSLIKFTGVVRVEIQIRNNKFGLNSCLPRICDKEQTRGFTRISKVMILHHINCVSDHISLFYYIPGKCQAI